MKQLPKELRLPAELAMLKHCTVVGDCWLLPAKDGEYARVSIGGSRYLAHQLSFLIYSGVILDGIQICHHCDVKNCVNPAHIYAGSAKSNAIDRENRGLSKSGEQHERAKLTLDEVFRIRNHHLEKRISQKALGDVYGVSQVAISMILRGVNWGLSNIAPGRGRRVVDEFCPEVLSSR